MAIKQVIRSLPAVIPAYQFALRCFRRQYWRVNARGEDLNNFQPRNYPAELFWSRVNEVFEGTVVEIGCGNGRDLIQAARDFPTCHFIGIDIQGKSIATANAKASAEDLRNVRFLTGDALSLLRTTSSRIDVFCACASLIYLNESELRSLFSLLRVKGVRKLCEVTAEGDQLIKTHLYIHAYKRVVEQAFPGYDYRCEFFAYGPWEGAGYRGAVHAVTAQQV